MRLLFEREKDHRHRHLARIKCLLIRGEAFAEDAMVGITAQNPGKEAKEEKRLRATRAKSRQSLAVACTCSLSCLLFAWKSKGFKKQSCLDQSHLAFGSRDIYDGGLSRSGVSWLCELNEENSRLVKTKRVCNETFAYAESRNARFPFIIIATIAFYLPSTIFPSSGEVQMLNRKSLLHKVAYWNLSLSVRLHIHSLCVQFR